MLRYMQQGKMVYRAPVDRSYTEVAVLFKDYFRKEGKVAEVEDEDIGRIIRCDISGGISLELTVDRKVPVLSGFLAPVSEKATPTNINRMMEEFLRRLKSGSK